MLINKECEYCGASYAGDDCADDMSCHMCPECVEDARVEIEADLDERIAESRAQEMLERPYPGRL
jgi:hypothetical protein